MRRLQQPIMGRNSRTTRLERENGVVVEFTTPYTPEQNGVAERLNRTLTTKIRAMLAEAGLPQWLWGEAAYTACYLHNRTPRHYGGNHVMTPKEMWTVRKPDLGHLRGIRLRSVRTARPGATK
jgi:transposase InsO family protein